MDSPDWEPPIRGGAERFHCVVLEGLPTTDRYSDWVSLMSRFFERLEVRPSLARVNLKTERFLKFDSFVSRYVHERNIDRVDRSSVALFLENDGGPAVRLDFPVSAVVSLGERRSHAFFIWRARATISFVEMFEWLIAHAVQLSDVPYAYAFGRDARFGPTAYVYGHIVGINRGSDVETEAVERIGAWAREHWPERVAKRYRTTMIRDVYRIQAMSEDHLRGVIFGQTFQEWIQSKAERGFLQPLASGRFLWTIPGKDLLGVRAELAPSGILIAEERSWDQK